MWSLKFGFTVLVILLCVISLAQSFISPKVAYHRCSGKLPTPAPDETLKFYPPEYTDWEKTDRIKSGDKKLGCANGKDQKPDQQPDQEPDKKTDKKGKDKKGDEKPPFRDTQYMNYQKTSRIESCNKQLGRANGKDRGTCDGHKQEYRFWCNDCYSIKIMLDECDKTEIGSNGWHGVRPRN